MRKKKEAVTPPKVNGPTQSEIFTPGNKISAQTAEERIFVLEYALKITVDAVFPLHKRSHNMLIPVTMFEDLRKENEQLKWEIERLKKRLSKYTIF